MNYNLKYIIVAAALTCFIGCGDRTDSPSSALPNTSPKPLQQSSNSVRGADTTNVIGRNGTATNAPNISPPPVQPSRSVNPVKIAQANLTGGVGAIMIRPPGAKQPAIAQLVKGSPAEKAGLQKDDVVVSIDGVPTQGRKVKEIVDQMRGFVGTTVVLKISRRGTNLNCSVSRTSWNKLQVEPPPLLDNKFAPEPVVR